MGHWLRWFNTAAAAELRDDLSGASALTFLSPALFAEDAAHGADSSFVARGPPPAWLLSRLEGLPDVMERLEAEIAKLETLLSDPDLYRAAPVKFQKATEALTARQIALAAAEEDWINLEEKLAT